MSTSKQRCYAGSVQRNRRIGEQLLREKGLIHPVDSIKRHRQQHVAIHLAGFFEAVSQYAKQQEVETQP